MKNILIPGIFLTGFKLVQVISFDLHDITHHITHYEATTGRELLDIDTEAFTNYLTIRSNPMKTKTENKIRMITNMYNIIENPYYEVYKWDSSDRFYKPMSTCSG